MTSWRHFASYKSMEFLVLKKQKPTSHIGYFLISDLECLVPTNQLANKKAKTTDELSSKIIHHSPIKSSNDIQKYFLVESGNKEGETSRQENKEFRKKDAKVLLVLQQSTSEVIFPQIINASNEFHGDNIVINMKLQTLCREFENIFMKSDELVHDLFSIVAIIINQMRIFGEDISEKRIVEKILRSLPSKFYHLIATIEQSKDLSIYSQNELIGAFEGTSTQQGHGRRDYQNRGHGRGHKNSKPMCNFYKYDHIEANCWDKKKEQLFITNISSSSSTSNICFIDSGCNNHMTGEKDLFQNIDTSMICDVTIGDENGVKIKVIGTIIVHTKSGVHTLIYDIYFFPKLAYNLLSVGQLLECGFIVHFKYDRCVIKHKKSGMSPMLIPKVRKRMFPLDISRH
ncbi:unnamed protein product [Spirodela intermedia]|uniref:Retrovirus-related Pol polyprotein from transposon TNT 1-94-like beta-barrel domain-containing protein n=1 Tax=Spirodela intermedia TaxID=51605 RepID=A0A7I8LJR2_SPIIN|nr:unnamed protein product [Spirodela intermedia]